MFDVAARRQPDNPSRDAARSAADQEAGGAKFAGLSAKRELNRGFGNALSTAVELSGTPALFGFIGWRLDDWLGTSPFLFLFLFLFTVCYQIWKLFGRYDAQMRDQEARVVGMGRGQERHP